MYDNNSLGHPGYAGFRLIFEGDILYDGNGWKQIDFDANLSWDGQQNIEFLFENHSGDHALSGFPTFIYTNYSGFNRTVYNRADDAMPYTNGLVSTQRMDTQLITQTAQPPSAAALASPLNGGQRISTLPTLSWEAVDGATGYKLSLWHDLSSPVYVVEELDLESALSFVPNEPLLQQTTYYWQVIPYNRFGDAEECPVWSFTTCEPGFLSLGEGIDEQRYPLSGYWGY